MTLVVAWLGVDTKGPGSIYIASDSRISWGNGSHFDFARKVFAFNNHPDVLGYCGDVLFPSIVLSQIVEMADSGLLFKKDFNSKEKFNSIKDVLNNALLKYPKEVISKNFQVIHISREPNDNKKFLCHLIKWDHKKGLQDEEIQLKNHSSLIIAMGSGEKEFSRNYGKYQNGDNQYTSRNVFHCFCDTLFNIKDTFCGGAPQLAGLYRKPQTTAVKFGIIKDNKRYLFGAEVDNNMNFDTIEWRNELFELCDGNTMLKLKAAQPQPNRLKQ